MQTNSPQSGYTLFFIIGPLRTGSSLMSRCIDDHELAVCLCESEINRALYQNYSVKLHSERMRAHGFSDLETIALLEGKKQDHYPSLIQWYRQTAPRAAQRLGKTQMRVFGDKSPDYFVSQALVDTMAAQLPMIYTTRDPRAILRSIHRQDVEPIMKKRRWDMFLGNIRAWKKHLDRPNILDSRYEDLVRSPMQAMTRVYNHLGLPASDRFLQGFERKFPRRFLWDTAIDWNSGVRKDFDAKRAEISDADIAEELLPLIYENPDVVSFMRRFGYGDGATYTPSEQEIQPTPPPIGNRQTARLVPMNSPQKIVVKVQQPNDGNQ